MRKKLTPAFVMRVKPTDKHEVFWDTEQRGFGLLVLPSGVKSFVVQYRVAGRSRRMTFKSGLSLTEARKEAKAALGTVAKGGDPLADRKRREGTSANTLKAIAEEYFNRDGKKLRSIADQRAAFERVIFPTLGTRQIDEIRRSDVVRLLDKIQDERGPSAAQSVLAYLSKLMNWHASRDDDFRSPIVRGMARVNAREICLLYTSDAADE